MQRELTKENKRKHCKTLHGGLCLQWNSEFINLGQKTVIVSQLHFYQFYWLLGPYSLYLWDYAKLRNHNITFKRMHRIN